MAEGPRMTTNPMPAVAVRRFRASGHRGHAKSYRGSKAADVFSHWAGSFSNDRAMHNPNFRWPDEWKMGRVGTSSPWAGADADKPERLDWSPERADPQLPQPAERLCVPTSAIDIH
jgi:hypothetical protein